MNMGLIGIGSAFIAAVAADIAGNDTTRQFSRKGFWGVALLEGGASVSGLASFASDAVGVVV